MIEGDQREPNFSASRWSALVISNANINIHHSLSRMRSTKSATSYVPPAILLLGPTGAGKTPLGEMIGRRGLWGCRFVHFDFGDNLRRIVRQNRTDHLIGKAELDFLGRVLESGALLENEHFHIAQAVLQSFLAEHDPDGRAKVLLNGLPRHVDQAKDVDQVVQVESVISLSCSSHAVLERIRNNVGGDRTGRVDDDLESIRNKLALFADRTAPLVEHYRELGISIEIVEVSAVMTPEDTWQRLNQSQVG